MGRKKKEESIYNGFDDVAGKEMALNNAVEAIRKRYGDGAVLKLGDKPAVNVDVIPTGSLSLDMALGVGGVPRGRIIEIFGPESSGKTTLALHMVAEAQKRGGWAGYIDAEHALDPVYAEAIGVDIDNLYISQPGCGEEAMDVAEMMIRSGAMDIIVVDSVAALTPKAEIEGDMDDLQVGLHARLMSKALRKLTACLANTRCTMIFINQLREKVGIVYGNPEVTTGGRSLKFYSSVRLDIRRVESLKEHNVFVGNHVRVKVVKNKVAPPFKEAHFEIIFGEGINKESDLISIAADRGIIRKSGAWYFYGDEQIGQGKEKTKNYLKENPEVYQEIKDKVISTFNDNHIDNEEEIS